jgi:hypothetical protein
MVTFFGPAITSKATAPEPLFAGGVVIEPVAGHVNLALQSVYFTCKSVGGTQSGLQILNFISGRYNPQVAVGSVPCKTGAAGLNGPTPSLYDCMVLCVVVAVLEKLS